MNKETMYKDEVVKKYGLNEDSIYMSDVNNDTYYFKDEAEKTIYTVKEIEEGIFEINKVENVNDKSVLFRRLGAKFIDYLIFYIIYIVEIIALVIFLEGYKGPDFIIIVMFVVLFFITKHTVFDWVNFNNRTIGDVIFGIYKVDNNNRQLTQGEYARNIYTWPILFSILFPILIVMMLIKKDIWNSNRKYITKEMYKKYVKEDDYLMKVDRPLTIVKSIKVYFLVLALFSLLSIIFSFNVLNVIFMLFLFVPSLFIVVAMNVLGKNINKKYQESQVKDEDEHIDL